MACYQTLCNRKRAGTKHAAKRALAGLLRHERQVERAHGEDAARGRAAEGARAEWRIAAARR